MKKLLLMLSMLCLCVAAEAQTTKTSATFNQPNYTPSPYSTTGPMINTSNAYAYLNIDNFAANWKDTITTSSSAQTIYLTIAQSGSVSVPRVAPVVAVDTFVPYPLFGYGSISFMVTGLKISGTPSATVTLQQSADGINWIPSRASTTAAQDTLTITNVATAQSYIWDKSIKYTPYYRLAIIAPSSTQSTSFQAWYFYTRQFFYTN